MEICLMCSVGYHLSCIEEACPCRKAAHIESEVIHEDTDTNDPEDTTSIEESESRSSPRYVSSRGSGTRSLKRDSTLKDQQSTGRKRAARMYPLDRTAPCEWRGKANCGGGPYPIIGCISGLQEARHHGPDKSVSNNEPGNVHRICHYCHYNWHAKNNKDYDWNSTVVNQHNPREATTEERNASVMKELEYKAGKAKKIKD